MQEIFKQERDTIVGLGLLAAAFVNFDPIVSINSRPTHVKGFNVQCIIVDNVDGEVLAVEKNWIHRDSNPLNHAEQVAIRAAMKRLHEKRPRAALEPADVYFKNSLFMAPGKAPEDFVYKGCTLYNSFDPCGMCALTLLIGYMKRIAFLFDDETFKEVYDAMRPKVGERHSIKEPLSLVPVDDQTPLGRGAKLILELRDKVKELESPTVKLVNTLDFCYPELKQATEILIEITEASLRTTGSDRVLNVRTLNDLKKLCIF